MKKLFIVAAVLISGFVSAQTELQKKKADFFATEAITYFKADESKKASIADAKLGLMLAQREMEEYKKSTGLTEADLIDYRKKKVFPFSQKLMNILAVKWNELNAFNEIVNPKMNGLK
jgi:hypothetical protein